MANLLKSLRGTDWALLAVSFAFIVAQVWLDLTMPEYMAQITRLVQTPGSAMGQILSAGAMMLLCALGSLLAAMATAVCSARIASNLGASLRRRVFAQVQAFSMEEIGRFSTASLITRSTNDITQVQMLIVMGLQMLVKAPLTAIWAVFKIAGKAGEWTLTVGAAVGVLFVVVAACLALTMPKFKKMQSCIDDVNRVARENLAGLRVVRAYNAEAYQEEKFERANAQLTGTMLFTQRVMSFMMPSIQLVLNGLSLAIYWMGAVLIGGAAVADQVALLGDMMVFAQYGIQIVMSFMMLVMIFIMLPRAAVSVRRIGEVLNTCVSIADGTRTEGEPGMRGEVEFRNVSFGYPDAEERVLQNISFTAHRGQTVAIIGSTGCGKSTVIQLIPRFYDATEGSVLVDGVDVRDYTQHALRGKIGYVTQKATLFTGTVRSNVAYGAVKTAEAAKTTKAARTVEAPDVPDAAGEEPAMDDASVWEALEVAQAADFVDRMDGGLDAAVAQGGANLSGGQRQRIAIARALARKPEILVFDDSFSALDYKTDRALRDELDRRCADVTRIVVAQRIGTIRDADAIIVLDDGKIAGQGRHEELMQTCEVYRQIAFSQLSKEELA